MCECQSYTCLEAKFNPCSEGVVITIVADETALWRAEIEFSNEWTNFSFSVTNGEKIVLPTQFLNEHYDHQLRLFDSDNELVGCYTLRARAMGNAGDYSPINPVPLDVFDIVITEDGNTITGETYNRNLVGKTILIISIDGQSYNKQFWSKPLNSDTITSNILTFNEGQIVTIIMR